MKFKRLSEDKLQIIISQSDLNDRNMKKWDLVPYNPDARELFEEILERASEDCGFEVKRDTQLIVEAYPISGESMIMTITKITDVGEGYRHFLEQEQERDSIQRAQRNQLIDFMAVIEDDPVTIYEFEELEHVIETAHALSGHYEAGSQVFKGRDGKYYLLFDDMEALDGNVLGHLLEYGSRTRYSRAFLNEHTEAIIADGAIEKLATV